MRLTDRQRELAAEAFTVGLSYLSQHGKLDTDLQSELSEWACQIVTCPTFPADRPEVERASYVWVAVQRKAWRFECKERRRMGRAGVFTDDLIGNGKGVLEQLIRDDEIRTAARQAAGIKQTQFSRKQYLVQRERRKRIGRERGAAG